LLYITLPLSVKGYSEVGSKVTGEKRYQGVNLQLGRFINEVDDKFNITLWKDRYSSCPKKMQVVYLFNVAWGNHITIVIPSRTLSTVVTYY
jgi:hypothetical protein